MSDNLKIYNSVRQVPKEALKEIQAGRLRGKSDINPMWRIKALTEQFGVCGFGWKYEIAEKKLEHGGGNEISAFVDINLYVKMDGEWSAAIPGTGGSSFVAQESKGPYTSDECFKMALTDAISVACKALGIGADVYWDKDKTKYDVDKPTNAIEEKKNPQSSVNSTNVSNLTEGQIKRLHAISSKVGKASEEVKEYMLDNFKKHSSKELTKTEYDKLCNWLEGK